jgi:PhnB protein
MLQRFKDIPGGKEMAADVQEKIMHVSLPVWKWVTLMATDALESMGQKLIVWNNFSISINVDSKEEADRLYKALSEWWEIKMPLADVFWGAYYAMFSDKFGIQWMINYDYPK